MLILGGEKTSEQKERGSAAGVKLKTARESLIIENCGKIPCAGIMWQKKCFPMVDPLRFNQR